MKMQSPTILLATLFVVLVCDRCFSQRVRMTLVGETLGGTTVFEEPLEGRAPFSLSTEFDLSGESISQSASGQLFRLNPSSSFEFLVGGNRIEMVGPLYAQLANNAVTNTGIEYDAFWVHGGDIPWLDGYDTGDVLVNGQLVANGHASLSFYDSTQTMLNSTDLRDFYKARDIASFLFSTEDTPPRRTLLLIGTTTVAIIPEPSSAITLALTATGLLSRRQRRR